MTILITMVGLFVSGLLLGGYRRFMWTGMGRSRAASSTDGRKTDPILKRTHRYIMEIVDI